MRLKILLKKAKRTIKIIPCKYKYYKVKSFIEENSLINELFPAEKIREHLGVKPVRDNIFHPDLPFTQLRYFRMYEYFKNCYPEIFNDSTKVLNVGDSSGLLLGAIKKKGDAVNIDGRVVNQIIQRGLRAYQADIYNLPFEDKIYDYVMSFQCLEHLDSPLQGLKELVRVAKKRVFISIPYREKTIVYNKHFWEELVRLPEEEGGWGVSDINKDCDYHIFELSTQDFLNLLSYTNFTCKKNFPINYFSPLGRDKKNRGSYFNFFDLEPAK